MRRAYFHRIDRAGRLFHGDEELTDGPLLDLFFRTLMPNRTGEAGDHPFVSPCAGEWNFLACEDTPIVFKNLVAGQLIYGATLKVPFDPGLLRHRAGFLYHAAPLAGLGLLSAPLLQKLAPQLSFEGGLHWQHEDGRRTRIQEVD